MTELQPLLSEVTSALTLRKVGGNVGCQAFRPMSLLSTEPLEMVAKRTGWPVFG